MYKFRFDGIDNTNQYEELIQEFLRPFQYQIVKSGAADFAYETGSDKNEVKLQIFKDLTLLTGNSPRWGILTGIRPVKLAYELKEKGYSPAKYLQSNYLLDKSKAELTEEILDYQMNTIGRPEINSLSMYVGIPFCPTRCLYCSFTSNQADDLEIERYLDALYREIEFAAKSVNNSSYKLESLYFGGGTPTTLNAKQLAKLLHKITESFDLGCLKEFTVEAGRPDTIDMEKLKLMKSYGVNRISINPQTMNNKTLELIGRRHTVEDVYKAFESAGRVGFEIINTDLIAGLPEETFEDFICSVKEIAALGASNITLHTLAVKRASKLREIDEDFNYKDAGLREHMLDSAHAYLRDNGFEPYYLYRQKHTSGNTENTGFCRDQKVSVYNIRIMEEAQSILALGAGGISKIYFPDENRLERVANVSNYEIYIDRINEMLDRKRKRFFIETEENKC